MTEPIFPSWTASRSGLDLHRGLYPLGLEAVGAGAVARHLLPGIPGSVLHPRYFSFLCWAFWTHHQYLVGRRARRMTAADQRAWLSRLEHALRAATLAIDPDVVGLVGRRSAPTIRELAARARISLTSDRLVPSAFVPAAYSASFAMLGCGQDQQGLVYLTETGERLAEAFDARARAAPGADAALQELLAPTETVRAGVLQALGEAIAIRPLEVGEPEHALLVDLFFRTRAPRDGAWGVQDAARSRCLALLLDIVRAAPGALRAPADVHDVFATGGLPDGTPYAPPACVAESFGIWQRYEERQAQKLGLHGFWHEITQFLLDPDVGHAPSETIVDRIVGLVAEAPLAVQWLGPDPLTVTVAEAERRVLRRATDRGQPAGRSALNLLQRVVETPDAPERAAASLVLVLLATASWRAAAPGVPPALARFHEQGHRERLALGVLTRDAEARAGQPIAAYVAWIVECCVLSQSTAVALEKLARGDYRFFVIREDDGFRVVRPQDPGAYLARDASRLDAAFASLSDLRLIDASDGYRLTSAGRAALRHVLSTHADDGRGREPA